MSNHPLTLDYQRELLQDLLQAVADRVQAEEQLASQQTGRIGSEDESFHVADATLDEQHLQKRTNALRQYDLVRKEATARSYSEIFTTEIEYTDRLEELKSRFEADCEVAENDLAEAQWMVGAVLDDDAGDSPKQRFETYKARLKSNRSQRMSEWEELATRVEAATKQLVAWRQTPSAQIWQAAKPPRNAEECLEHFVGCVDGARQCLDRLERLWLPRLFAGWRPLVIWLFMLVAMAAPLILLDVPVRLGLMGLISTAPSGTPLIVSIVSGLLGSTLLLWACYFLSGLRVRRSWDRLQQHVADARLARQHWLKVSKSEYSRRNDEFEDWYHLIVEERENAIDRIKEIQETRMQGLVEQQDADLAEVNQVFPVLLTELAQKWDQQVVECDSECRARLKEIDREHHSQRDALEREHRHRQAVDREGFQRTFQSISQDWDTAYRKFQSTAGAMQQQCGELFADWVDLCHGGYRSPEHVPSVIQLGKFQVDLALVPGGIPADERLVPRSTRMSLPALLPFSGSANLVLEADGSGRTAAVAVLQNTMLRLLTSLPPGKLRFTVIDPVGLGENFSAFMHLADFDELLISGRIWTESSHIDQQLSKLTEHMEDVFQSYLRNQFESIEEYNEYAGEVAEPYHVLVVANFPVNFSDAAVRRLVSIASSGARCGVHTLVSVDSRQQLPHNFDLADLRQHAGCLAWTGEQFSWQDRDLAWLPLELESPPPAESFVEIVRAVGEQAKDTRRVEVPFGRIAPSEDEFWGQDSRHGIDVPLGRAGATKLQHLQLGQGTSQHVMIAGKTGSGKSSFLHTLITNVALHYGPDEVEFYLIDFKKGVEFKTYVTNALPHARVIAIESDREFGVSVLERLDGILQERGDLFRRHRVQDLAGFRDACPDEPLPRVLLIIDEFQEFFVEDDRVHQEASLLLDRLVRQGRAFGVHVLLGSQTLGGAYSLARSTLGQVAVRVALQCSESDAHLILSEDNTAARLLTRPGEAIYNDANGLLEGNHPFQIAWLSEDDREACLGQVRDLARQTSAALRSTVVFEGNVPADPAACVPLKELLQDGPPRTRPPAPRAWLGEAVQIKPPPELSFRRQSGSNLLLVGQQPEEAHGVLATAAVALAAQHGSDSAACFHVLDGTPADEPYGASWQQLAEALPHSVEVSSPRKATRVIESISSELSRRDEADDESAAPIFLLICNLGRFRELRPDEDDLGFGGFGDDRPTSPSQRLATILRNGPALGIHVLVWCDTYNNVSRWLSSATLRDMELRVAFQMSAADSSNLVDSSAAGRLGNHRALLYLAEHGTLEKFRPFGVPPPEWIKGIGRSLSNLTAGSSTEPG